MYDPNLPQAGTEIDAVQMRSQLNGLKALIDAIVTLTAAQIDGVTTLLPGETASVGLTVVGSTLHFTFGIPRGDIGTQGQNGMDGAAGPQGPPFANAVVDAVNTLNPGDAATVSVIFDGVNVHFSYGIPRGNDGSPGQNGSNGGDGPQGPPGEVTNAALTGAIIGTSSNSNAVATLDTPFVNDPPTLADMEVVRVKMNELITALRR
ncbi:MAG: hypothetical protein ABL974_19615 [Prosthecobacter sp.]